jgi:hypothetical protein
MGAWTRDSDIQAWIDERRELVKRGDLAVMTRS